MSLSDPIGDMIARVKNAQARNHKKVELPSSNFKSKIADILKNDYGIEPAAASVAVAAPSSGGGDGGQRGTVACWGAPGTHAPPAREHSPTRRCRLGLQLGPGHQPSCNRSLAE